MSKGGQQEPEGSFHGLKGVCIVEGGEEGSSR